MKSGPHSKDNFIFSGLNEDYTPAEINKETLDTLSIIFNGDRKKLLLFRTMLKLILLKENVHQIVMELIFI